MGRLPIFTRLHDAWADRRGNVAILFSLAILPLVGFAGAAVDYGLMGVYRAKLQAAADTGAIQAGKELRLAQMGKANVVAAIAKTYASAALAGSSKMLANVAVDASLLNSNASVQVTVTATYKPLLLKSFGLQQTALSATATATSRGYPICALSLDGDAARSLYAETQARVTAQFCAAQANSNDKEAIYTQGSGPADRRRDLLGRRLQGRILAHAHRRLPCDARSARLAPAAAAGRRLRLHQSSRGWRHHDLDARSLLRRPARHQRREGDALARRVYRQRRAVEG